MPHRLAAAFSLWSASLAAIGCGPSTSSLEGMARRGEIDRSAPVSTHLQIAIDAPPAKVWNLLVNAPAWPSWQSDVKSVSPVQPLAPHSRFDWETGGTTIHSQVQFFKPEQCLVWTGNVLTIKAVHAWRLSRSEKGGTVLTTDESIDGPLIGLLFSSKKLAEADEAWLTSLKQAAERAL